MADNQQTFQWVGIEKSGKRSSGYIQAADSKDAQNELAKRGIEIVKIEAKRTFRFGRKKLKVKPKDILLFTRHLSTMVSAGLPLMQALDVIGRDQENPGMQNIINTMRSNIASGKTLSESFSQYPQYFSDLYCSLIKTGEKSGTLDKILKSLGSYLEKTEALKRKIKKAMVYPAAIIVVAFVVTMVLLIFVVPRFQSVFSSFGAQLPAFTRIVIHVSEFLRSYWWIVIGLIVGGVIALRRALKQSEAMREKKDALMLKLPVLGGILRKAIIARYTRTLAITLDSGMPIVDAMRSMAEVMGNSLYSKAVLQICSDVTSGNQLYVSMTSTKLFPTMVTQMIAIGEASGSLGEMLNKIADYYEEEVNGIVDNLSSLLEPLIMVVLGVIIGGFVIAMYLPIFKIGSLF